MKIDSETGLIRLDKREEWDDPMFERVEFNTLYRQIDNPGVVRVGCR